MKNKCVFVRKRWSTLTNCTNKKRVFSNDDKRGNDLDIKEVKDILEAAEIYTTRSARIEYCRSRGINYEKTVEYLPIVERLSKTINEDVGDEDVGDDIQQGTMSVKKTFSFKNVSIAITTMASEGCKCLVCDNDDHLTSLCPSLPDELRPFFIDFEK